MITLGTGVGSGIVINGEVVYGHDGFAGELGHTSAVRNNGRACGCGKTGCLEAYASATGVARTAREWLELTDEPSLLRNLDTIASKDVYDAAKEGDKLALKIFEFTGKILGRSFADFIAFSAPEAIVLFGGLARSKEFLTAPMEEAMNANVLPLWRNKVKIVYSQLKESDAAILGASALAWEL
jgi:glucokinase